MSRETEDLLFQAPWVLALVFDMVCPLSVDSPALILSKIPAFSWLKSAIMSLPLLFGFKPAIKSPKPGTSVGETGTAAPKQALKNLRIIKRGTWPSNRHLTEGLGKLCSIL